MITDLTSGKPKNILWRFLLPMLVSVMFQQFYNIADSMIAGKFAGEDALASVGASYPITVIFMAFATGSNLGASVIVSRFFGAKDYKKMKSAVATSIIACLILSAVITALGYLFCSSMMRVIGTPWNIFKDGVLYLKIYILGLTFLFLYNVCTGIFTALGDSKTPLYFLIGSSIGNIILDFWFVAGFHWGVTGVAWATFIAQGLSCILAVLTLRKRLNRIETQSSQYILFNKHILRLICAIAVPSIMQQSVLSVGNLFIQGIVNRYGSATIAGYSASIKLNTFAITAFMALGSCMSSYTSQNLGAHKKARIPLGFRSSVVLSLITALPFFVFYFFFGREIMGMFLDTASQEAIRSGMSFMRIVSPWYFMIAIKLMTDGIIRGYGAMAYFVIATVPDLILRILFAYLLTPKYNSTGIWMAWPFGWIAATVLTIIFYRKVLSSNSGQHDLET